MQPERLRIAFATPEYVTEKAFDGGIANYLHRVAKALAGLGHDIHVITLSVIDEAEFEHEGVTVHRIASGKTWLGLNRLTRYRLKTNLYLLDLSAQVYRKLKQLNSQQPFHLVQFPDYSYCGLFSILFLRVPHVLRASWYQPLWNELNGAEKNLDSKAVELLERLQFRLSPHVFAPSQTLQQKLAQQTRLDRVRVIPTPIYLETKDWDNSVYTRLLKDKKYLLFFGRFELRKGFHILAQALPRLLAQHPDAHAVLVGRDAATALAPSMADFARERCATWPNRLILLEELPHRQLYPIIDGAHLVVLPSLIDNLPNACLEAMTLGKPVIGTNSASFDELITNGLTGFLVPPNDPAALTEKILHAWTHPQLRSIGQAARRRMMDFAPEKTVAPLLAYYREILQG